MGTLAALQPRYNIAPAQPLLQRQATQFRWGLIPSWSRTPKAGLINARAETVAEKPSFRQAFCCRRCLSRQMASTSGPTHGQAAVLRVLPAGSTGVCLCRHLGALAQPPRGGERNLRHPQHASQSANEDDYDLWRDPARLLPLLRPYPAEAMAAYPVSTHVNNPCHEDPPCRAPIGEAVQGANLSEPAGSASPAVAPASPPVP